MAVEYTVILDGPEPDDLAQQCAAVWRDIYMLAEHAKERGQSTQKGETVAPPSA